MKFFNLFKKAERIAELETENKKLIEDNHDQYEDYCNAMTQYHTTAMELERLKVEHEALKKKMQGSGSAQIAHDHKVYQDGLKQGQELMAEDMRKALGMPYEELVEYSDDKRLKGEMFVSYVNDGEHTGKWAVHDRICQYGGCDMPTFCNDEMVARTYVATMNVAVMPLICDVCNECQKEYYGISNDDYEDDED